MDRTLILLVVLLVATLAAYFAGVVSYPLGWLVIAVLIFGRLGMPTGNEHCRTDFDFPRRAAAGRYRR